MLTTRKILRLTALVIAPLMLFAGPTDSRSTSQPIHEQAVRARSAAFAVDTRAGSDAVRTALKRLPEQELKGVYQRCNQAPGGARMPRQEIALCSVAYDVLLKQHFRGDFEALLAWSRDF